MNFKRYKKHKNSIKLILFGLLFVALFILPGCTKWENLKSPNKGRIYMAQAYSNRSVLEIFKISSPQSFTFGASVAGFEGASSNITVEFEVDNSLLAAFNQKHAYLGYDFVAFPKGSYTISGLETTIEKGMSDSKPLTVSLFANKIDPYVDYCLPIKIKSISQGNLDTALSISYFTMDSLYIRSRDVTGRGKLSVSNENGGGIGASESSVHVTDNNYTTKYLYNYVSNSWIQLKLDSAVQLNAYTLTSGNDAPGRDPKDWKIQGSNDGSQWVTLDERSGYSFVSRLQTVTFELNHPDGKSYLYYRMLIENNNGSGLFQMTEWRLLQYY